MHKVGAESRLLALWEHIYMGLAFEDRYSTSVKNKIHYYTTEAELLVKS